MDANRLRLEHALYGLGLFTPARKLYALTAGRKGRRDRTRKREFFSHLLNQADLVFDVGANLGNYSEIFASLGAKVVAVEPNLECVYHIRRSYPSLGIEVVSASVGASSGVASIRIAERSDLSSMSREWIDAIRQIQKFDDSVWAAEVPVAVITLDSLIQKYGTPKFIKIDVEGFEENVLAGLSTLPPLLSFEFNTHCIDSAFRCLERVPLRKDYLFNFVVGEPFKFELENWVDLQAIRGALEKLPKQSGYGDIFVRTN
jgi:FkbM family methyltransferase